MSNTLDEQLQKIFDADRALRHAQQDFVANGDEARRVEALSRAIEAAEKLDDAEESAHRLMRAGDLLGEVGDATSCKLLLRLLDHEEPGVRTAAGEALLDLGYSRYAEVARAIEKAIDDGKAVTALAEVPYILAEIGEPGGVKLCARLLKHGEADVVGAAIEALAAMGDASAIKDIERLRGDKRAITSEEDDAASLSVGDLAQEALDHLRSLKE